jgi:hypothetical protein
MNLFNLFSAPKPADIAEKHLRLAQLQLLEAHGAREAANAQVNALQERVRRLTTTVQTLSAESPSDIPTHGALAWTKS